MKLKSISCDNFLASCRYCDDSDGKNLLQLYRDLDFEQYDNWDKLGCLWGYTELPERMVTLTAYTSQRTCFMHLALEILKRLYFPNLQCAALIGINDLNSFINLIQEWNKDANKSKSVLWSILEVWKWKLRNSYQSNKSIDDWQYNQACDNIGKLYNKVLEAGFAKDFARWLFSKGYRNRSNNGTAPSIENKLCTLMEAVIIYNWEENQLDENFENLDYLSFIATDIDEKHPLNRTLISTVLNNYYKIFKSKKIHVFKLPMENNSLTCIEGFSEVFWKHNKANLYGEIQNVMNEYQSIFEGWRVKGKMHDFASVQNETFILCALLLICKCRIKNTNDQISIFCTISERLFLQIHNCPDIYLEYYSVPACLARYTAESISTISLTYYDNELISRHHNMEQIANILNCSANIALQQSSKVLYKQRWTVEKNVWERRFLTTGQFSRYNIMQKIISRMCS